MLTADCSVLNCLLRLRPSKGPQGVCIKMKYLVSRIVAVAFMAACFVAGSVMPLRAQTTEKNDVLFSTMRQELQRAQSALGKLDPAPYFTSYSVHDESAMAVVGSQGGILSSTNLRRRSADVIMRVGAPALDNTHGQGRSSAISTGLLPLDDDADAIARALWSLTYN